MGCLLRLTIDYQWAEEEEKSFIDEKSRSEPNIIHQVRQ